MAILSKRRVSRKKRIDTIRILVNTSRLANDPRTCSIVDGEFNQVVKVEKVRELPRRALLQVLHATRALDSTLKAYLVIRGCTSKLYSLREYLTAFTNHSISGMSKLNENTRKRYEKNIVYERNRYMHEAGAFPNTEEQVTQLLSEMEACLSEVLRL